MPKDKVILSGGSLSLGWLTIDAYDLCAPDLVRMWVRVKDSPIEEQIKKVPMPRDREYARISSVGLQPVVRGRDMEIREGILFSALAHLERDIEYIFEPDGWSVSFELANLISAQVDKMESAELVVKEHYAPGFKYREVEPDEVAKLYFPYLIAAARKTLRLYALTLAAVPA